MEILKHYLELIVLSVAKSHVIILPNFTKVHEQGRGKAEISSEYLLPE